MVALIWGQPAGAWALLAVPALLAIHFLQQRRRRIAASTLFLLEHAAPVSVGGSRWERLRVSRALLGQLAAVLLATWVLLQPRWQRADATRTVAVVLDASASLAAFRVEAIAAARAHLATRDVLGVQTEWLVLTSDPREPVFYRGRERAQAEASLARWQPTRGTHDPGPVLRAAAAAALAGGATGSGETLFLTDRRSRVPTGQPALGVGRPLENVGFAGGVRIESPDTPEGATRWRALVRHHGATPQKRTWWVEHAGRRGPAQRLTLAPGALVEIAGEFPAAGGPGTGTGAARAEGEWVVVLEADAFATDDRLPVVLPVPRPLTVAVQLPEETAARAFFDKVLAGMPGVVRVAEEAGAIGASGEGVAALRIAPTRMAAPAMGPAEARAWIVVPGDDGATTAHREGDGAGVTAESHPLTDGLTWSGWFGAGPGAARPSAGAEPLLWQGSAPLVWLEAAPNGSVLWLNFSWTATNAARLPATVLLIRRFVEQVQARGAGTWAENVDAGQALDDTWARLEPEARVQLSWRPAGGGDAIEHEIPAMERAVLRAPVLPGFFTVEGAGHTLHGAAQFADARQADFTDAATFASEVLPVDAIGARTTQPDPWTPLWLGLAGVALGVAWWPARAPRERRESR